jgi:heme A synthase
VNLAGRYLAGLAVVGAAAAGATATVPPDIRAEVGWGSVVGLILQAPLGWWALRAIGSEQFLAVWGLGMLVRFTAVGIAGLVVIPALHAQARPMLASMVGVLVALLLVEGATALREHSREHDS